MGKPLAAKLAELPPEARRRVERRTAELVAEELAIRDLRKAMRKTQAQVARELDIGQVAVSRIEQRSDLMISTLRNYLRAVGAELELRAVFNNGPPVRIAGFADIRPAPKPRAASRRRPRA